MKAFVYDHKTKGTIAELCQAARVEILTQADVQQALPLSTNFFLDDVDVLIMEITKPTPDIHFILAQAILADKPTLCLYAKNQTPRELLSFVKQKKTPRAIKTFSYIQKTLAEGVQQFIQMHDPSADAFDDLPSIKYTLRLTPRIDRYLEDYVRQPGGTKADCIRQLLEQLANQKTHRR